MPTLSPKKSETLEIRLSHPAKQAFMARCRAEGRTASEALRAFIETPAPRARSRRGLRLAAGVLAAGAVAAVALPTLARPNPTAEFERLDADRDGRLSLTELTAGSGEVQVRASTRVSVVERLHAADQARIKTLLLRTVFDRLDADGDGTVSKAEYGRSVRPAAGSGPTAARSKA